jgi:drug/metabolite transporter (DMT)-like permease
MTTVIGVAAGILILGEAPTPILFIGAFITLSGISIILWRNKKQAKVTDQIEVTEIS